MSALEKKAVSAALDHVLNAQVMNKHADADQAKIDIELKEARSWLEVFFVVEKKD